MKKKTIALDFETRKALEDLWYWVRVAKDPEVSRDEIRWQFGRIAKNLDAMNIPWSLQNAISCAADNHEDRYKYLSTIITRECARLGIEIAA